MGYYSDTTIVMTKELAAAFEDAVDHCPAEDKPVVEEFVRAMAEIRTSGNGDRVYSWTDVKWYPSYPEISFIETFLDNADWDYKFMRLGEDDDDVEVRGCYEGVLYPYISRNICIEGLD